MDTTRGGRPSAHPKDTLPAGRRDARAGEEGRRTSAFVLLRFTLLIATSYMLLAAEGFAGVSPLLSVWIGVGLASNVVAARLPRRLLEAPAFGAGALVFDTLWITAGLVATGRFEAEFFYLYFFVLFLAAVGESLGLIALGTVVVSGAYLYALISSGTGSLAESSTLIRLPFLFAVASFYGYLVQRVRRERHRAGQEAESVRRLEEVRRHLETANRRLEREARERRRAEEQVRKLSRAVEQSPSMVIITDLHGRIEYANPRFAAVTGFRPEEVVGRELRSIGVPEDGADEHPEIAEVLASGTGWRGEIRYRRTDGELFWAATSISPLRSQEGAHTHFIVVQEDVTERRQAEESLRQANRELAKVSELKSAFVATVSHELRTPLTSIRNALDIVRSGKPGPLAPDQRRFLDMARRNQERLATIIDDLLDLSKIEAGRLEYGFEEVEAARLLAEVGETFEPQAVARTVEI
ncbi:MAG TPA: PAS domain S-box protein, partial [Thermoanaerobaculia bacterium]|nr:PAS domain S-box protein [Thermoanaerobaculia bacterium]